MNWFRENRSLALFLVLSGVSIFGAVGFLFMAKNNWDEASSRISTTAAEWNRLERLSPYPNAENLRKMKAHAEEYSTALARLKEELKLRVAPVTPMAPNEFQSRLRVRLTAVADKARENRVKLPDKFHLGFDEFISALPNEVAAPLLGQELEQIEWIFHTLLDARVEAVTAFRRTPLPAERVAASVLPSGAKSVERNVVEATFVSTPGAARKVINQIAAANEQFCIIRLLHVRNENQKGPPREEPEDSAAVASGPPPPSAAASPGAKPSPATALNFIVGNERIETTAKIEIVRFTL
jgi:hypothetical protein